MRCRALALTLLLICALLHAGPGASAWTWARRVGEALQPGPGAAAPATMTLIFGNVTTPSRVAGVLSNIPPPCALLAQEARMDGRGRDEIGAQLLKLEGNLLPGPVDHNDVCILCTGTRGVAARSWEVPLGVGVAGRLQHVALFAGGAAAHVLNIYSPVGETPEAAAQCVELVQAAMGVAAGLGPVPIFLGGTLISSPSRSMRSSCWLRGPTLRRMMTEPPRCLGAAGRAAG